MLNYFSILLLALLSCNSDPRHDYDYRALKSFSTDTTSLSEGEAIEIIALSGSDKNNDEKNVYYHQVLVKRKLSGDTIRVLSPLFKLPAVDERTGREYFLPHEYNYNSKIQDAQFEFKDENLNILIQSIGDISNNEGGPVDLTAYFNGGMVKEEMVVINKTLPIFERSYKTVVGIIVFNTDPR